MYTYYTSRFINVDCSTEKYHNDNDAGSTIIKVPNQDKEHIGFVQFSFKFNNNTYLKVPMIVGVSIHFNGNFITHKQQMIQEKSFINISGYTNDHLVRIFCRSAKRKISNLNKYNYICIYIYIKLNLMQI